MKAISLVIPIYNEAEGIRDNMDAIRDVLTPVAADYTIEVLLINDGSTDATVDALLEYARGRADTSLISFNRNFGKESCIQVGLEMATGDAVIVMDSDLQHPPELISDMLTHWESGSMVVECYKQSRGTESVRTRLLANAFYSLLRVLSGMDLANQSDYKLLDRRVVNAYLDLPERDRFFRGLVHWMAYPATRIPFAVPERRHGRSKWTLLGQLRLSGLAIASFSSLPLQLVTWLGGFTFLISFVIGMKALYDKFTGQAVDGFTTVILIQLIIGSTLMVSLGLLGTYLARVYDEVKSRPSYLIDEGLSLFKGGSSASRRDSLKDSQRPLEG